jgi:hypothetical protein
MDDMTQGMSAMLQQDTSGETTQTMHYLRAFPDERGLMLAGIAAIHGGHRLVKPRLGH